MVRGLNLIYSNLQVPSRTTFPDNLIFKEMGAGNIDVSDLLNLLVKTFNLLPTLDEK